MTRMVDGDDGDGRADVEERKEKRNVSGCENAMRCDVIRSLPPTRAKQKERKRERRVCV